MVAATLFLIVTTRSVSAQEEPLCVENSRERRGEIACSIIENKPLAGNLKEPLFWHIDRFETGERARAAVGPASIAFEAHGAWWLMSIESQTESHHGGQHVTEVKTAAAPGSAQIFNGGDTCVYPFGLDVACTCSLRRGSVLRG